MTTIALRITTVTAAPKVAARHSLNRRPLSQRLEPAAVLSLLGTSAAYALFTLTYLACR